jgi:2-(1,2-epoxy-1,2-dihydrophenyl)acetyl-CoA isomerase
MSELKRVSLEIIDGLATITLSRPDVGNSLDAPTCDEFARVAESIVSAKASVRTILITAAGKSFCVGGDVSAMAREAEAALPPLLTEMVTPLHKALVALHRQNAPIVACVRGAVAGAGLSLVALADIVVASSTAKFTMAYTGIGLSSDGGASWSLPRIIGLRRSIELALTNRRLGAAEALAWGLVTRVVEDDVLDAEALATARLLADGPTLAYGAVRRLMARSLETEFESHLDLELKAILRCGETADAIEGVKAFAARRRPLFSGS